MSIQYTNYGTLGEALEYFSYRLHSDAWDDATLSNKQKALIAATRIIDTLNFKGTKATVHTLLDGNPDSTEAEIRVAEAEQDHEFPRGADTTVPSAIEQACYEIAFALLDGRDPDMELEALAISSQGIESVRTTYSRNQVPQIHLINGVPSHAAWRLLQPFLRDDDSIKLVRV